MSSSERLAFTCLGGVMVCTKHCWLRGVRKRRTLTPS